MIADAQPRVIFYFYNFMAGGECALVGVVLGAARFYYTANNRDAKKSHFPRVLCYVFAQLQSYYIG